FRAGPFGCVSGAVVLAGRHTLRLRAWLVLGCGIDHRRSAQLVDDAYEKPRGLYSGSRRDQCVSRGVRGDTGPVAILAIAQPAAKWTQELFDDHQNQTVIALVDLIIPATDTPGAKAALVNRHMDHILGAAPEDEKTSFREGLWWVDGYAIRKHGKPFASCNAAEQTAILKTLDAGTDPDTGRGHKFFQMLKGMTSR